MHETKSSESLCAFLCFRELFSKTFYLAASPYFETKTQTNTAISLFVYEPVNMMTLSAHAGIAPEQATRSVKALRDKGLVTCSRDSNNHREVIVRLTKEGRRVMDDYLARSHSLLKRHTECLNDQELSLLAEASRRAADLFEELSAHQQPEIQSARTT